MLCVGKNKAAAFSGTNRAAASTKPTVRGCLPAVTTDNALPPHFFIRARRIILWGANISFIIPFLNQGRTLIGNTGQLFRMIGTIGAIMSSPTPIGNGSPPFMSLLASPPNHFSTSGSYIPRCKIFIFFRMPLGGNSWVAGLQAVFFTWTVAGTIRTPVPTDSLIDRALPCMPAFTAPPHLFSRTCSHLDWGQRIIFRAVPLFS